jgi:signal transduction histidine kinase
MKPGYGGHGRLVLLFLVAVILPSLVLVLFTLRMIGQERELAEKRLLDDRTRLVAELDRFLLLHLENIKLQETDDASLLNQSRTYRNPEVILVCRVMDNRLLLPWDDIEGKEDFSENLKDPDFSLNIRSGEKEEFEKKNPEGAVKYFTRALNLARNTSSQSYARLLLARALVKTGKTTRAAEQYHGMLASQSTPVDEYGIHLSLYACRGLLELGESPDEVLTEVTVQLQQNRWHTPPETYLLKDLLAELIQDETVSGIRQAAEAANNELNEYQKLLEQALALQRDFEALHLLLSVYNPADTLKPLWTLYGNTPWLVNLSRGNTDSASWLVAVDAGRALESAGSEIGTLQEWQGNIGLAESGQSEGVWLGANFPDVRIDISGAGASTGSNSGNIRRSFYWLALLLVLGVTLFGSYVVTRDVRRELRMAEMRSQFVSSVSHELKTPLTAIRMFAETLSLGRSPDTEARQEYLDTIVQESERLTRLLNNVLDFSKIETGRMVYRPAPASLADIVRAAARMVQYPLNQQGFRLNIEIEDGIPEMRVDRDAIDQAILNLLSNAMKYSGTARDIDLSLQRHNGDAVIRVTDHGVGITEQEQTKIFEKFYRVNSTENERITGTGLGLALAAHIVKAHGGRIDVESTPGRGSTFSIYLPLEREP